MVKWNFDAIVHIGSIKESYLQSTWYIGIQEWLRTDARCSLNKYMYKCCKQRQWERWDGSEHISSRKHF